MFPIHEPYDNHDEVNLFFIIFPNRYCIKSYTRSIELKSNR